MRLQSVSQMSLKSIALFNIWSLCSIVGVWSKASPMCRLGVCKGSLHTGTTLLFYIPLPQALLTGQPHGRATVAFPSAIFVSLLPVPPSPCRQRSWGQLQTQCLLLNPCLPLQVPCGISTDRAALARGEVKPLVASSSSILSSHPCLLIVSAGKGMDVYWMPPMYQSVLQTFCISINPK